MKGKIIRVLIAKPGLDGHDRGAKVIAQGLRDAGMEVVYLGLRSTPEQIVHSVVQEDVDVVGLSCLSGAHMLLFPKITRLIQEKSDRDILIIGGGIIPKKDIAKLRGMGMAAIFGPGSPIAEVSDFIKASLASKKA